MEYEPVGQISQHKRDGFRGETMIVLPVEAFSSYIQHPIIRRMYLTDVGYFPNAAHHYRERREGCDQNIFLYCTAGAGIVEIGRHRIPLQAREAFTIPADKPHRYYADPEDPWSILLVHFLGEDCAAYPLSECRTVRFDSEHATDRMMSLFDLLFRVLDANYTEGNFIYISQVLQLILSETYYREKTGATEIQNQHITRIIRYMMHHLEGNLTLDEISARFDLSKSYLNTIFQRYTQHSPMDFYINLKMKRACSLLRATDLRIYEIASGLGYDDPYYFSRLFKKVTGTSPRNYRYANHDRHERLDAISPTSPTE